MMSDKYFKSWLPLLTHPSIPQEQQDFRRAADWCTQLSSTRFPSDI